MPSSQLPLTLCLLIATGAAVSAQLYAKPQSAPKRRIFSSRSEIPEIVDRSPRIKIPLSFQKYSFDAQHRRSRKLGTPLAFAILARLDQPNHFYFNGYHIATQPRQWDPKSKRYQIEINFIRSYANSVEERLGSALLKGRLLASDSEYYLVDAQAVRSFTDKWGELTLRVYIGVRPERSF